MPVDKQGVFKPSKIWAVVPAAGVGKRMGGTLPKQYLSLSGRTILETTLNRLGACASVDAMVVGISQDDSHWSELAYTHPKLQQVIPGGAERAHTVLNALRYIIEVGGKHDWALVHDAVRPCVRTADIQQLVDRVTPDDQGGILAVAVSDTVKRADAQNRVAETVSRQGLWRAMTPQLFPVATLAKALEASIDAGYEATDESAAMERLGCQPQLVACQADNIKITNPDDLALAKLIIQSQH